MTKRDMQASEYAAESYEKPDENRTNTTMKRDATPGEGSVRGVGTVGNRLNENLQAEIARLCESIRRLAEQDATLSVCDGNVTVTHDATLTDEEREAIEVAAAAYADDHGERFAAVLRNLLERLK